FHVLCFLFFLAVKRLMKEAAELKDPTDHYHAQPLEDNLFEWHFTVRGPPDSDFDGGIYHGRIVLPPEYPMKPPSIILLTANGRFEVGKKICLSISGHHPETWQPSWSIRTALLAIIGFMPTKGEGAIGSLDYTPEERRALAKNDPSSVLSTGETSGVLGSGGAVTRSEYKKDKDVLEQIQCSATMLTEGLEHSTFLSLRFYLLPILCAVLSDNSTFLFQSETQSSSAVAGQERSPAVSSTSTSMSPRQRRAQQQSQRRLPTSADFNRAQQPRVNTNHTGSTVLIVLLTFALAALIFRRICLANEYVFE
ncbi:UB2J1 enzyme, partial [Cercotrichas coryphoeus]|nr:UB2J1 enzyme [Cercotrichas coryphoeus]